MSIGSTTIELWKRAPAWRYCLIAAVALSVVAVMSGRSGGGNQNTVGLSNSNSGNSSSGSGSGSDPRNCGPAGQTSLQAPIVVSSTGQMPGNVQGVAVPTQAPAIPNQVQANYVQFITQVDAARLESRQGERCVKMQGALEILLKSDYAYADCFQQGSKKLVAAQACSADLDNSDIRFQRLSSAFEAGIGDNSAARVEELARARKRMTPFDQSRELWNLRDKMVLAGDRALQAVHESDTRIAELNALGNRSGENLGDLVKLAKASDLTAFDKARLSQESRQLMENANEAKTRLDQSDRRLATVTEALDANPAGTEASRATLASALSALTELDYKRANTTQKQAINKARSTVAQFASTDLVSVAKEFDPATADPREYERLRDLLIAITNYGEPGNYNSDTELALATAKKADTRLSQSDRRIKRMHDIVSRVEKGGPAELGPKVLDAYQQMEPFDLARMNDENLQYYQKLEAAKDITLATQEQELTPNVPLFISASNDDELSQLALNHVRRELKAAGFNLVPAEEQSAVTFALSRSEIEKKTVRLAGSTLNTAEVSLSLAGKWTVSGKTLPIPTVKGDAAGNHPSGIDSEAIEEAAEKLVSAVKKIAGR